ncbi:metalloregulator ArsR/SmtB family transcription factor [Luteococcus peritonei]|uniref:ArsR/SmtB family transcription factor n=1 Tax=Luteococcus peritonei TaxID=88874 RepID=A0ABW4RWZ5_9ACTN
MTATTTPIELHVANECCPPSAGGLGEATAQQLAALAKVLGDPVRLRIYAHIAASECSSVCACHLPEVFGVSQPTLSHHLKKLVEAGLVDREMRGRWAHFSIHPGGLALLRGFLDSLPE